MDAESGAWRPARREARAVAAAIDAAVVAVIGCVALLAAMALMLIQVNPLERDPSGGEWTAGYAAAAMWFPAAALYIGIATLRGGTLGARMAGLRVLATPPQAIARALLWWPGLLFFGAALWLPWLDAEGRGPADRLTGTRLMERADG